jgi:hypothetical protein
MACIENLPYEMVLPLGASFAECKAYVEAHSKEVWYVDPGFKLFDSYLIGLPPIAIGLEGDKLVFPYTKPCHGTYLLSISDAAEADRVRKVARKTTHPKK